MKRYTQEMIDALMCGSAHEVAATLGISPCAVYKARSRLRKGQLIAWDGRMRKPLAAPTQQDIGAALSSRAARLAARVHAWAQRATVTVGVIDGRMIVAEVHTLKADEITADASLHVGTYSGPEALRTTIADDIREHLTPAGRKSLTRIIAARNVHARPGQRYVLPLRDVAHGRAQISGGMT